jgi:drug/metabolite transporter (DMT)-like permease
MAAIIRGRRFAALVPMRAAPRPVGLRAAARTRLPWLHLARAGLHAGKICLIVLAFTLIGLINTHAVFAVCPILIALLARPVLGEGAVPAVWIATLLGFAGILVLFRPGTDLFTPLALLPLALAAMLPLDGLPSRLAARREDGFVAVFWLGVLGAALMTAAGAAFWEPMSVRDWGWTAVNGALAVLSNWLLIRAHASAEAAVLQPFAYLQLVFVAAMGTLVFAEPLAATTVLGAAIVVAAGLLALVAARPRRTRPPPPVLGKEMALATLAAGTAGAGAFAAAGTAGALPR